MSELLKKVEATGKKMDKESALNIEDIDLSKVDKTARRDRVICVRCEQEVLAEYLDSHMNSHSSEILPWLFLGGNRNAENTKELTVRTGITHILNLARECNLWDEVRLPVARYNESRGLPFIYKKYDLADTADQDLLGQLQGALDFV